jgi:NADH:ubiquinone oxidoreductase subunit D
MRAIPIVFAALGALDELLRGAVERLLRVLPGRVAEYEDLLSLNPVFLERTRGVGVITGGECRSLGATV